MARQYVFPYDAEDIKAHKFFKGLPWEHLHTMPPPFVPNIRADDDTRYFDDGNVSDSEESSQSLSLRGNKDGGGYSPADPQQDVSYTDKNPVAGSLQDQKGDSMDEALDAFDVTVQMKALTWIATPYDSSRLKIIEAQIGQMVATGLPSSTGEALLRFIGRYGKRERKRPRDRLLRDRQTKKISMELRKRNAFLGYTWRRIKLPAAVPRHSRDVEASIAVVRSSHRGCF